MQINLTDKEIKFLKQYAQVYDAERNLDATADPIVLVQNKTKIYTHPDYSFFNDYEYELCVNDYPIVEDGLISDFEKLKSEIKDSLRNYEFTDKDIEEILTDIELELEGFYSSDEFEDEYNGINIYIKKHYFIYVYETVAYFFTRAEAENYLNYQGHNLHEPRVYTDFAGYSNKGDYPVLSKLLLRMGQELNANLID